MNPHMWLDLRKPGFHTQLQMFRNTDLIIWSITTHEGEADACMKFAMII